MSKTARTKNATPAVVDINDQYFDLSEEVTEATCRLVVALEDLARHDCGRGFRGERDATGGYGLAVLREQLETIILLLSDALQTQQRVSAHQRLAAATGGTK